MYIFLVFVNIVYVSRAFPELRLLFSCKLDVHKGISKLCGNLKFQLYRSSDLGTYELPTSNNLSFVSHFLLITSILFISNVVVMPFIIVRFAEHTFGRTNEGFALIRTIMLSAILEKLVSG